jgi:hypothetical protein
MDQQEELVFRTEQTETESQRGTGQISKLLDEKLVSVPGTRRSQELQEFRSCRSSEEAIGDRSKIVMQELRSQELQKLQEFRRKAANRPRTQKEWYSLAKAIEYV